ncbi:hypothetical protein [Vibrio agarivorans]|uniref:Uncharacterized protein n=1 Tax=Vibrio agarivorans TaxID=153622 RepID=A0ABT7Y0S8_9VIBR|nr:hypothetical protein [Vibrio agarivorans]MDN2481649.1 hypothetical protein [Vibrio agarivorans]
MENVKGHTFKMLSSNDEVLIKGGKTASAEFAGLAESLPITRSGLSALTDLGNITNLLGELRKDDIRSPAERAQEAKRALLKVDSLLKSMGSTRELISNSIAATDTLKDNILNKPQDSVITAQIAEALRAEHKQQRREKLTNPDVIAAIAKAPSFVFGLTDADVKNAQDRFIKELYPDILDSYETADKALRMVERAEAYGKTSKKLADMLIHDGNFNKQGKPKLDTSLLD